jgi:hypothetical protein
MKLLLPMSAVAYCLLVNWSWQSQPTGITADHALDNQNLVSFDSLSDV